MIGDGQLCQWLYDVAQPQKFTIASHESNGQSSAAAPSAKAERANLPTSTKRNSMTSRFLRLIIKAEPFRKTYFNSSSLNIPRNYNMVSTRSSKTKRDTVDNPEIEKERPAKKPKVKSVKKMAEADASSGDGPVYFWRESHPELGYLSQWYYCPFQNPEDPSKTYKTAEQ